MIDNSVIVLSIQTLYDGNSSVKIAAPASHVLTHLLLGFGATAILNDHGVNFSASLQLTCQLLMPSLAEVRFKHGEQSRRE